LRGSKTVPARDAGVLPLTSETREATRLRLANRPSRNRRSTEGCGPLPSGVRPRLVSPARWGGLIPRSRDLLATPRPGGRTSLILEVEGPGPMRRDPAPIRGAAWTGRAPPPNKRLSVEFHRFDRQQVWSSGSSLRTSPMKRSASSEHTKSSMASGGPPAGSHSRPSALPLSCGAEEKTLPGLERGTVRSWARRHAPFQAHGKSPHRIKDSLS
jgi:hypothetical protein